MTDTGIQEKVIAAVVIMNAAIINLRLYPPTNAMIIKTIERLHEALQNILEEKETLLLAETEKSLLIFGKPLTEKNRQKPQVAIFLMLMANWGIKSILFNKGLEKSELSFFLQILGKKPDGVIQEKELDQIISDGKMPHIHMNQKRYVEVDQDRQIVTSLEIKDADIIQYMTHKNPDVPLDPERLKEMARDRGWVSRIFQSGMQHLADGGGGQSSQIISESMLYMLGALDEITDHAAKEELSSTAAKSISDMDADLIAAMMSQNMEGLLENRLFDQVIDRVDHKKFEAIVDRLHQSLDRSNREGKNHDGVTIESARQAYQRLMSTDKGVELKKEIETKQALEKEERKNKIGEIKEKIGDIFNRFERNCPHENDVKCLSELVDALCLEGETAAVDAVIERLIALLDRDRMDILTVASESLAEIFDHFPPERRTESLTRYGERLTFWMKRETTATGAFRRIGMHLKDLAEGWIRDRRFADSLPLLDAFSHITSKRFEKNDSVNIVASEILREMASPETLDVLIEEFRTDGKNQGKEAGKILVATAERSIDPLLDLLMKSEVSSERVLILNLIPEMGCTAVPAIVARITEDAPWHSLRNLARLLGRIGSEEHAKTVLAPLLLHGDVRVQKEAFRSINGIGGASRGEIILNALAGCDDQLKASMVAALGSLKCKNAAQALVELFKSKTNLPDEMKVELQEKICIALGNTGNREALPFLKEISTQSGLFGFKSYHSKVKAAAGRALGILSET